MKSLLMVMVLLASCSDAKAPPASSPDLDRPPSPAVVRRLPPVLPVPPKPPHDDAALLARAPHDDAALLAQAPAGQAQTVATLTAADIIAAADQARIDALGYIVWSKSQPDNITRLNTLTDTLTAAVKQMQDHATAPGVYLAPDVVEARGALTALRTFLRTKGD